MIPTDPERPTRPTARPLPAGRSRWWLAALVAGLCATAALLALRSSPPRHDGSGPLPPGSEAPVAPSASAPAPPTSNAADALFEQGRRLVEAGQYPEACARFEDSQRMEPAIGTLLHLADCYERRGSLALAWETFSGAAHAASAAQRPDRERKARERALALEPRLAWLIVEVPAARDLPGLSIRRDGQPLERERWNTTLPIDPGLHTIEAEAPGYQGWSTALRAHPSSTPSRVPIPRLNIAGASPPSPPAPPPASAAPRPPAATAPEKTTPPSATRGLPSDRD